MSAADDVCVPAATEFDRYEEAQRHEERRLARMRPYLGPLADHPLGFACCELPVRAHEGWDT